MMVMSGSGGGGGHGGGAHRRGDAGNGLDDVVEGHGTGAGHGDAHAHHSALLLLALRRQLPVPRLNALLLHRQRPVHLSGAKERKEESN